MGRALTLLLMLFAVTAHAEELARGVPLELNGALTLPLAARFPAQGDAPGGDLLGIPRPIASRRVLSAQVRGRGYGVIVYETTEVPAQALAAYTSVLAELSFRVVSLAARNTALVWRGDEAAIVHGFTQGGRNLLALVRMAKEQTRAE